MTYDYIEHQFCEYMIVQKLCAHRRIDIETVCQRMGVSAEDLTEYLSERLSTSFSKVVQAYRIEEAKELWAKLGTTSIRKVARAVGYGNSLMFMVHFVKHERCLPYVWKQRNLLTMYIIDEKAKDRIKILKYISTTPDPIVSVSEIMQHSEAEKLRVFLILYELYLGGFLKPSSYTFWGIPVGYFAPDSINQNRKP